jgi:hypothetical protein
MFHYPSVLVAIVAVVLADPKAFPDELKSSESVDEKTPVPKVSRRFAAIREAPCHDCASSRLTDRGRLDKNTNDKLDLAKLRAHLREKPRTKAGQVRQAWPEIKQLLASGHSLKDICQWLNEIGLEIGYARLSDYVCQLRRREAPLPVLSETETETEPVMPERNMNLIQPLAHILEREKKRGGFSYNAEPDPKKLI